MALGGGPVYLGPRSLAPGDQLDGFECRSAEQTQWLREHAHQAHASRSAHVMVITEPESPQVVAYYAWTMASMQLGKLPSRASRGVGRYPQGFALLARLGVDVQHEAKGLGHGLLADVLARTAELGNEIACRGLLVHAESDAARDFYLHALPGLEASPVEPLHLVLLMKDIRVTLRQ